MRRMLGFLAATTLVGLTSTASADQITGPIQRIDRIGNMFVVDGIRFAASPHNTVGAKLAHLKPGDVVTVFYEAGTSYAGHPWNAMVLKKHS
jgi:hypothetical protein